MAGGVVERRVHLPADAATVWRYLLDDDLRATWFGEPLRLEARPGATVTGSDSSGVPLRGEVELVVPRRRLAFSWWEGDDARRLRRRSRVELRLDPVAVTVLTVVETLLRSQFGASVSAPQVLVRP